MRPFTPLGLLALFLVAGCGGGGGHHSGSGSSSSSTVTFAANEIVFGIPNGTGTDFAVAEANPAGGTSTVVADVSGEVLLFAADPSATGRFALAAAPSGSATVGVYLAKGLGLSGAAMLVAPTYAAVTSLAVMPDGGRVVYTATTVAGASELYVVSTSGGTPTDLGPADGAALAPNGDTVAYVAPVGGSGNDAVFTRSLAAGASGAATTVASNAANHALPAFSPDGARLAYWTLASGANALTVQTLATDATVNVPGVSTIEPQGTAFGPDGTRLALVGQVSTGGQILTAPVDGSAAPTPLVSNASLLGDYGFFWTDALGRAVGGMRVASAASRARRRSQ